MAKGKYKKNKNEEEEEDFKKKKPMITEEHLMDKSNMDYTNFVPISLADVLNPPYNFTNETINLLKKLITDFNYLLYIDFKKFWATLLYNPSLKNCISNLFETLSVKALNIYKFQSEEEDLNIDYQYDKVRHMEAYQYIQAIEKVLLIIIYRMMHFKQQNAQLSQIYNLGQAINNKYLFSIPKMFQMIAIYGQSNKKILNVIFKSYIRTVPDFYKIFIHQILPPLIKRLEQTNRQMKHLTDRQQFGISYSYKRNTQSQMSPGEEQLKRKVNHLMLCIQFIQIVKGTQFLTQEVIDNIYFNHQVHFVLQNMFYELDAAYKIWNFQEQGRRLLPMMNYILYEVKQYFIQYFDRANRIVVEKSIKSNTVDAYVRSLQRIFQDYGKRSSIGKKAINNRNLNLYKLIVKKFDLTTMLQKIYIQQQENQTYQINMEYLVDFKLTLEDSIKKAEYINQDEPRQQEIQQQTEAPEEQEINDIDAQNQQNKQQDQKKQKMDQTKQQPQSLTFLQPKAQQTLQVLVSKKSRQDDYYLKLYKNHQKRFKADYQDQYDDLVDYDKRPIFMDDPSSDSQSEQQERKHYVNNKDNQKLNQQKHQNYQLKRKQSKKETKQSKYSLVKDEQISELSKAGQKYQSKGNKKRFQSKEENQNKKYKEKNSSDLNNLIQQEKIQIQYDENGEPTKRTTQRKDDRDHRYKPQQSKQGYNDKKKYEQKGKNSNKNRDHQGGGNQKYKYRPK